MSNYIAIRPNSNQRLYLKNIKLEKGNKATDWTPAPEDIDAEIANANNNSANAIAQAQNAMNTANLTRQVTSFLNTTVNQNVVATGTLMVGDVVGANGGITGVTDNAGESVRMWFGSDYTGRYNAPTRITDDGTLYSREIDIESVLPGSNARVQIKNGLISIFNGLGNRLFEFGAKSNNEAVFNIFNTQGALVASIGQQGIVFNGFIPEAYTLTSMFRIVNQSGTIDEMALEAKNRSKNLVSKGGNNYEHNASNPNTTSYMYNAGHNMEAANNQQYNFKYFTSENKLGANLADGWYAVNRKDIITQSSNITFSVEIIQILNGDVVDNDGRTFTEVWSWFLIL